ncbi:hypothetical protein NDU88_007002 [Pleurodeles waltl]|uniref:Uncharacterized protein n=1 Tax=Pleurodeles waltl TaxID=8319 RepID=A0AAV7NRT5_PLEWA|nr:hypothetical protein NDU88_007002 [Pleurodeles waltl]
MDGPACRGVDNSPLTTARAARLGGALCTITWDPVVCCWCFMWLRALNEAAAFSVNASGGRTTPGATSSSSVRSTRLRCGPRGRGVIALLQAVRFPLSVSLSLCSDPEPLSAVPVTAGRLDSRPKVRARPA